MEFNELVKNIRKELNITQEQLAHKLNISFSTLNRWENGHTSPSKLAKLRLKDFYKNSNIDKKLYFELEDL